MFPCWQLLGYGKSVLQTRHGNWTVWRRRGRHRLPWRLGYDNGDGVCISASSHVGPEHARGEAQVRYYGACERSPRSVRDYLAIKAVCHGDNVVMGQMNFPCIGVAPGWRDEFDACRDALELLRKLALRLPRRDDTWPSDLRPLLKEVLEDARLLSILHDYCCDHSLPGLAAMTARLQAMTVTNWLAYAGPK